jgi:hypothetical protein
MASSKDHVPETHTIKPNREQRRHPERSEQGGERDPFSPASSQQDIVTAGNQDVQSVRAKNSGHGKKTADKWNQ